MRKTLLSAAATALVFAAGSAFAADLSNLKGAPLSPPPPPLWTGFYAGLNLGGGWDASSGQSGSSAYYDPNFPFGTTIGGVSNLFFLPNGNTTGSAYGVIGGGQVGYNFQFGQSVVIGAETDIQATSLSGSGPQNSASWPSPFTAGGVLAPVAAFNSSQVSMPYVGTLRGRAGYLINPTLLVYVTAGLAYNGIDAWGYSNTRTGWTAGGGVEWMFAPNWSAKLEYLYADLSGGGVTGDFSWNYGYNFHPQINIARVGVNYHFNMGAPAPVLAKY